MVPVKWFQMGQLHPITEPTMSESMIGFDENLKVTSRQE
jgi:hypothetical protein